MFVIFCYIFDASHATNHRYFANFRGHLPEFREIRTHFNIRVENFKNQIKSIFFHWDHANNNLCLDICFGSFLLHSLKRHFPKSRTRSEMLPLFIADKKSRKNTRKRRQARENADSTWAPPFPPTRKEKTSENTDICFWDSNRVFLCACHKLLRSECCCTTLHTNNTAALLAGGT